MPVSDFKEKSYWMTTRDYTPGEPLREDIEADVAIVGGGFTGLSSAYHIKKAEPNLRIALLESEVIGFGASGRNGGFNREFWLDPESGFGNWRPNLLIFR
ncbi:MAG: FAD-dependent oxidoreductase [bacterium]|nr:FAD-dependent oxidoreductase [bacterium]